VLKRTRTRRLSYSAAVLAAVFGGLFAAGCPSAGAQTTLRWSRTDAANSMPIVLSADEVATWLDQGRRVFLLKGRAFVEQDVFQARMRQAVVWVDEAAQKSQGVYRLEVFADGEVSVVDRNQSPGGDGLLPKALLGLTTRGKVNINAYSRKIVEQPLPRDPLYLAALAERNAPPPTAAPNRLAVMPAAQPLPAAVPGSAQAAPAPPVDPGLRRVSAQEEGPPPRTAFQLTQGPGVPPGVVAPPAAGVPLPLPPVPPAPVQPGVPGAAPGPVPELPAPRPAGPEFEDLPPKQVTIRPRSAQELKLSGDKTPSGESFVVSTTGVIITYADPANETLIDIEGDRMVMWLHGDAEELFKKGSAPQGQTRQTPEFYLSGNVQIRQQFAKESRLLLADEVYYDVGRNVAIVRPGELILKQPGLPDPMHLQSPQILQQNAKLYELGKTQVNASKLPYDAELRLTMSKASLEQLDVPKRGLFGLGPARIDPKTGQPEIYKEQLFRGKNVVVWIGPVPVFYLPYVQGDARDPLGPLENIGFNYNRVFGFQLFTTWDIYDLIGMVPPAGTRWRLNLDYMTQRGPAMGTDFRSIGTDFPLLGGKYNFMLRAYGIDDTGTDILGGNRGISTLVDFPPPPHGIPVTHPEGRGRFTPELNVIDGVAGSFLQAKLSAISDRNFLEQYFNSEWNTDLNQETYVYGGQRIGNFAWTALTEVNIRNWITETNWLPRADVFLIGQKFFDLFTFNTWNSAGYAHLQPTHQPPPPISPTDKDTETARLDSTNELSLPFTLGAFKIVPYLFGDVTYYSEDIEEQNRTRFLGGGGVRGSIPFSRLFPGVQSEFFNLNGLFHKIVLSLNYYNVHSDTPYTRLPQLDRINDDTTDQALRDIRPWQPFINPGHALKLTTSPNFDPQNVAIRYLVDSRIDTRDTLEVLTMDLRQRWQTKRGLPGAQHIVDWMTLDVGAYWFPNPTRDNLGQSFSFLTYDWTWHVGDRLTLYSNAWYEPISQGARTYTVGFDINRPDGFAFGLGYRQLDPLNSKNVIANLQYTFSPKYMITGSSGFDFGNNVQVNQVMVVRTGTDVQIGVGFAYNSIINTFSFMFEIYPNLLPANKRVPGAMGGVFQQMSAPR
jgi:hypothetical protein